MSSIFTQIINGELPSYKVYEDDRTLAFLNIYPNTSGHTLVIPKVEVDKLYDLSDEDYEAVMRTVKKVAQRIQDVMQPARVGIQVQGFEVPHAHVHVLPIESPADLNTDHKIEQPDDAGFRSVAEKLAF